MYKRIIKIAMALAVTEFITLNGVSVFAYGGATAGTRPQGGGCNIASISWDTCFGTTWQKYKIVKDLPDSGIYFGYTPKTNYDNKPVYIKGCKAGQYLYNYGFEVHQGDKSLGYQMSTQSNKNLPEAPHADQAKGAYNNSYGTPGNTRGYLEVVDYASDNEAFANYYAMKEYIKTYPDAPFVGDKNISYDKVGAFCFTPDALKSGFEGDSGVLKGDNNTAWDDAADKVETQTVSAAGESDVARLDTECGDDGCDIDFRHYLKRTFGDGKTKYKIIREIVSGGSGIDAGVSEGEFPSQDTGERALVRNNTVHMQPGDEVCETLEFSVNGEDDSKAYSKVCAAVRARPTGDEKNAAIWIELKNEGIAKYSEYGQYESNRIFAKPNDRVGFRATYDPAPQEAYNASNIIGINKDEWKNAFWFSIPKLGYSKNVVRDNGDSNWQYEEKQHVITNANVGENYLSGYAKINPVNRFGERMYLDVWSTPTSYKLDGDKVSVEVRQMDAGSTSIWVPYNFDTSIQIEGDSNRDVSAGETGSVEYTMRVEEKGNSLTADGGEKYRTVMRGVKIMPIVHVGGKEEGVSSYDGAVGPEADLCTYYGVESCNMREDGPLEYAEVNDSLSGKVDFPVPDMPAGTNICVAVAVYPANSGNDSNILKRGSNTWRISDSKCYPVAKKPSVQVWGGNVAANTISAPFANKKLDDKLRLFGSWGELAVSVPGNDKNKTMASGAAWGYASNNDGALQPNPSSGETSDTGEPGGGMSDEECDYSVLTFGSGCGLLGKIGGGSNTIDMSSIGEELGAELGDLPEIEETEGRALNISNKRYYRKEGDINIGVKNILIDRNNRTNSLDNVPQVVIYAKGGSINIDCDVERIDAILLADVDINTCAVEDKDLKNYGGAQTQLIVNGAMYANGDIYFYRTYGAGTGTRSIVPAEIVNYDNSMLFTGGSGGGTANGDGVMDVVYVRELAPRY